MAPQPFRRHFGRDPAGINRGIFLNDSYNRFKGHRSTCRMWNQIRSRDFSNIRPATALPLFKTQNHCRPAPYFLLQEPREEGTIHQTSWIWSNTVFYEAWKNVVQNTSIHKADVPDHFPISNCTLRSVPSFRGLKNLPLREHPFGMDLRGPSWSILPLNACRLFYQPLSTGRMYGSHLRVPFPQWMF